MLSREQMFATGGGGMADSEEVYEPVQKTSVTTNIPRCLNDELIYVDGK